MTGLVDAAGRRFDQERSETDIYRPGIVTALNKTVTPWLCQIEGRWMPYVYEFLQVGDRTIWVDIDDPFAWSPVDPEIQGSFVYFTLLAAGTSRISGSFIPYAPMPEGEAFASPTSEYSPIIQADTNYGWDTPGVYFYCQNTSPNNLGGEADYFDSTSQDLVHGKTSSAGGPEQPYTDLVNPRFIAKNLDGWHQFVTAEGPQLVDVPPVTMVWKDYDYAPGGGVFSNPRNSVGISVGFHAVYYRCHSIREELVGTTVETVVDQTKIYLPRISVPGPDWLVMWHYSICPTWSPTVIADSFNLSTPPFTPTSWLDEVIEWGTDYEDAWNAIDDFSGPGVPLPAALPYDADQSVLSSSPTPGFFPGYGEWEWWDAYYNEWVDGFRYGFGNDNRGWQTQFSNRGARSMGWNRSQIKLNAETQPEHYPYIRFNSAEDTNGDGELAAQLAAGKLKIVFHAFLMNATAEDAGL